MSSDDDNKAMRVVQRRWLIGGALTAAMMFAYFGFIVLVAYSKPTAGTLLAGERISVGIVVGACTILLAPVLTSVYVRWANRVYDPAVAEMKKSKRS
jgi:uncharacterized membrane protein (DUF485 family)